MRVCVLGAGYVGLATSACLAARGNTVTLVDRDVARVEMLRAGRVPIHEPGLAALITDNVRRRRLRVAACGAAAIAGAEIIMICVGTPARPDGSADLSQLEAAADSVAASMREGAVIVIKSTVPVGTVRRLEQRLRRRTEVSFAVAFNPEFLREGSAVSDCLRPDRVVIGVDDLRAKRALETSTASSLRPRRFTSSPSSPPS